MAEIIDLPQMGSGTAQQQLETLYSYLYRLATDLNINFEQIGYNGLTDDERELMHDLTRAEMTPQQKAAEELYSGKHNYAEAETMKSLIIKTAQFVKDEVQNIRAVLYGEESASGQFGDWERKKGLRVDVTPDGVKQTFTYAELVKGHQTFEINSKNYIKTGYLRTENMLPVYGVAIGKDVVTFAEDGTETYNDSNKVAELTADALSFFNNGVILAKYTGTKTSFYAGGVEVMYIQAGKIYATVDLELGSGNNVVIGNWKFNQNGQFYYSGDTPFLQFGKWSDKGADINTGIFSDQTEAGGRVILYANNRKYSGRDASILFDYEPYTAPYNGYPALYPSKDFSDNNGIQLGTQSNRFGFAHIYWIEFHTIEGDTCWAYHFYERSSTRDKKHDIQDMPDMGDVIDRLRPVSFVYDEDPKEEKRYGLIYEETIDVLPEICTRDEEHKSLSLNELVPILLKEIKSLRARVSALEGGNG